MKNLFIIIIACITLCIVSCKTKYIELQVPVYITKIEYRDLLKYDSVYIHDSIDRLYNGDTITIIKYKDQYKLRVEHDTLVSHDTIPVTVTLTVTKTETKNSPINKWLLAFSAACIVYFIFKIKSYFSK